MSEEPERQRQCPYCGRKGTQAFAPDGLCRARKACERRRAVRLKPLVGRAP